MTKGKQGGPKTVRIGARSYRVLRTREAHAQSESKENTRLWGRIDHNEETIALDPDMGPTQDRETLLHEVLHGVIRASGGFSKGDTESEDGIIARLQGPLLAALRDNPALVAYLQEAS